MKSVKKVFSHGWALLSLAVIGAFIVSSSQLVVATPRPAATTLAESNDYATTVLQSPWDMSEFSDISQNLNNGGYFSNVTNVKVESGVFTATTTPDFALVNSTPDGPDPYFNVLWPGYKGAMFLGKVGINYPINAATYHCFYTAALVNDNRNSGNPAQMDITWYKDENLNDTGSGGVTGHKAFVLFDEIFSPGSGNFTPYWKLHKTDLSVGGLGSVWSSQTLWRGLRVDLTQDPAKISPTFAVDWVRLTDCTAVNLPVSALTNGTTYYVFLKTSDNRRIYIDKFTASGTTANVDLQGVQPGTYTYELATGTRPSDATTVVQSGSVTINQKPLAVIARPSTNSGEDYASTAGNPWDFQDASDTPETNNAPPQPGLQNFKSTSYSGGLLNLVSSSGPLPGGNDSQIFMNTPTGVNPTQYRYMTFRMNTTSTSPWQDVPDGMIARWIWYIQGTTGRAGYECSLVSHDIPYDVGWQTYSIDLHTSAEGSAEELAPPPAPGNDCDGAPTTWQTSGTVTKLRFDPDENVTCNPLQGTNPAVICGDFTLQLDYIRLTKVDTVQAGQVFPIQIGLNRPPGEVTSRAFYYTTNKQQPTQNPADLYTPPAPSVTGPTKLFLPVLGKNFYSSDLAPVSNEVTYQWNTTGVTAGTYYICVVVGDGINNSTVCSEAPIIVQ